MKLLELYEDFFQYLCRLNRMARTQAHPEFARVRNEVQELLSQVEHHAAGDLRTATQVQKLTLPLIFFVDNMICTSRLNFAPQWAANRLATERNELAGDERFFVDFLEPDLRDPSEEAAERLAVYHVCLGLGFTGMHQGQPEQIRRYQDQMFPRIRHWIDSDPRTKISEEAYRHTDVRQLTEPPSRKIALVGVAFLFLALSVLVVYYALYANAVDQLTDSVEEVRQKAQPAAPGSR